MKISKKILSCIVACAILPFSLAACGDGMREARYFDDLEYVDGDNSNSSPAVVVPDAPAAPPSQSDDPAEPDIPDIPDAPAVNPKPDGAPTTKTVEYIRVLTDGLNVRSGPSTAHSVLATVESGVLLKCDGKVNDFYKTSYLNRTAYVSAKPSHTSIAAFDIDKFDEDIERVVEEGLKVLGTKYVYGAARYHYGNGRRVPGFTVGEFDCSSLMQYIFYRGANVLLDMTSRAQSLQGAPVAKSEIRRGDLLFFTNASRRNNTGLERIGHVGLYLGQNYILHTASDYAKIEKISATRQSYYVCARRLIN